jgi:hypothetical protein
VLHSKIIHKMVSAAIAESSATMWRNKSKFDAFSFTGPLRPAEVTPQMTVPEHIPVPDYALRGACRRVSYGRRDVERDVRHVGNGVYVYRYSDVRDSIARCGGGD